MENSRSKELLNKVYDHLNSIDVSTLSMNELKDFLEVVQKGQFLESLGQIPSFPSMHGPLQPGNYLFCGGSGGERAEEDKK